MHALHAAGIPFTLARAWPGDRALERRLKTRRQTASLCPLCNPTALNDPSNFQTC